jgi:peptidoglycan/LPS O-acetylase OafA/YrhL
MRALIALTGLAAIASLVTALSLGSYDTGWGLANFWGAPVRLAYPFLAGLLLYRLGDRLPRITLGFPLSSAILLALFAAPVLGMWHGIALNGLYQAGCVLILFPAIIVAGRHSAGGPATLRLCRLAGRLSYPLYITHYPIRVRLYELGGDPTGQRRDDRSDLRFRSICSRSCSPRSRIIIGTSPCEGA